MLKEERMVSSFVNLVKSLNIGGIKVAEIGVREGYSTREYMPHVVAMGGHLWAVDWFKSNTYRNGVYDPPEYEFYEQKFLQEFKDYVKDYLEYMTILVGNSVDQIVKIPNRSLDIAFVDADHNYFHVMGDIERCLEKVKIGGILCGHDCDHRGASNKYSAKQLYRDREINRGHVGVEQAVYDWFGDNYELLPDSMWKVTVTGNERL
jgi:hypothetical protein